MLLKSHPHTVFVSVFSILVRGMIFLLNRIIKAVVWMQIFQQTCSTIFQGIGYTGVNKSRHRELLGTQVQGMLYREMPCRTGMVLKVLL